MESPADFVLRQFAPLLHEAAVRTAATGFIEAMTDPFEDLASIADSESHGGLGILFDVDACPDWALPWLGQCVGVVDILNLTPANQRLAIKERRGTKRGTVASLVSEVQATLTGTKFVFVIERYGGNPYDVLVVTRTSETPNAAKTEAAAKAALPAGRRLTYTSTNVLTIAELMAAFATINALQIGYVTIGSIGI